MRQPPVATREEALQRAQEWATGERSHMSTHSTSVPYGDIAQMDAAEVAKFTALAAVLPEERHVADPLPDSYGRALIEERDRLLRERDEASNLRDAAIGTLEGVAHFTYGQSGKIARDFLVANGIWNETVEPGIRVDPVYESAWQIVKLCLQDMAAATNADMAADGPVGNEESKVWEKIEEKARELRRQLEQQDHTPRSAPHAGVDRIAVERQQQVEEHNFNPTHDDRHERGELLAAAICYCRVAMSAINADSTHATPLAGVQLGWPWEAYAYKPRRDQPVKTLTKAGALIAAEIDRLVRDER